MKRRKDLIGNVLTITGKAVWLVVFLYSVAGSTALASNGAQEVKQISAQPYGDYLAGLYAASNHDLHAAAGFYQQALALAPENRAILNKSFTLFIADGRYDAALRAARQLKKLKVSDSMVTMFLFLQKVKANDYKAALASLDSLGDAGVYGLFKPLFRSWVLLAQGKKAAAEANMQKLLKNKSFMDFKKFHAGLFYDFIGRTKLAVKLYSQSLIVPGAMSLSTVEAYGRLLRRLGRPGDARQLYLNYLEKTPYNPQLRWALSNLEDKKPVQPFIASEKAGIAEIFYTAASFLLQDNITMPAVIYLRYAQYLRKDFFTADYLLGQIFEKDKYYRGALEKFDRIGKNHALYFSAQLQMAWLLEKKGKLDEAVAAMEKLSGEFPDNREILVALGDINRMHGRFDPAIRAYTKYIDRIADRKEKYWSVFYTRGIAYEQARRWKPAEADFREALKLHPDQPQVLNYLAYSWIDRGINIEKARKMLEQAVKLRPYDGYIIDSLGWALYKIGDLPQAVKYLEKAALLQTGDWEINDHLGDAYWAVGRKYEARFQWRHALSLHPDKKLVAAIRAKIKTGLKIPPKTNPKINNDKK
ncbi:MAG: tetratricopeptide repeat protein [Alphaproteobacteria bacterium]|nr:tetratricopeptide repeat protein [Alphaproteobacteria bacterium]